jgi:metallo-beta-lactamase class B
VNPGYKLVENAKYPQIAPDYEHAFQVLKSLPCDVFLGAHGGYYGMIEKSARAGKTGSNSFVDPTGYKEYVADRERAFRAELAKQQASRQ